MLNASTYPQPIKRIYGVVHSENFKVDVFFLWLTYINIQSTIGLQNQCVSQCRVISMILQK
jgi:hypothetical protein